MKIYQLSPKLRAECIYVTVKASEDRMFNYFVVPDGDGKFLQYISLTGKADTGVKDSDLEKVDFLIGFVSLPIFSERFVEILANILGNEITFYPIEIEAKTIKKQFFVGKINRYLELIDYEKSDTEEIDGELTLDYFGNIVYNENLPEFYIARDKNSYTDWFISEKLKNLIEKHKLYVNIK
ncbi:imm11 family protein [Capnocytophaga cynodegmi]|uniref:imm11 family protein n=1 Tax=Capnocytophaga cynodegmi TaxID=28189 RepID=UPI0038587B4F